MTTMMVSMMKKGTTNAEKSKTKSYLNSSTMFFSRSFSFNANHNNEKKQVKSQV